MQSRALLVHFFGKGSWPVFAGIVLVTNAIISSHYFLMKFHHLAVKGDMPFNAGANPSTLNSKVLFKCCCVTLKVLSTLNYALLALTMCRWMHTNIIAKCFLRWYVPLHKMERLHRFSGMYGWVLLMAVFLLYMINYGFLCYYTLQGWEDWDFCSDFWSEVMITGYLLVIFHTIIFATSVFSVRRKKFEIFYWSHHLFIGSLLLTFLHPMDWRHRQGSKQRLQTWPVIFWPVTLYFIDRLLIMTSHRYTYISKAKLHMNPKSIFLSLEPPRGFGQRQRPGHVCWLAVNPVSRFQWHPFSLASSSEAGSADIMIRCFPNGWTERLFATLVICTHHLPLVPTVDGTGKDNQSFCEGLQDTTDAQKSPNVFANNDTKHELPPPKTILSSHFHLSSSTSSTSSDDRAAIIKHRKEKQRRLKIQSDGPVEVQPVVVGRRQTKTLTTEVPSVFEASLKPIVISPDIKPLTRDFGFSPSPRVPEDLPLLRSESIEYDSSADSSSSADLAVHTPNSSLGSVVDRNPSICVDKGSRRKSMQGSVGPISWSKTINHNDIKKGLKFVRKFVLANCALGGEISDEMIDKYVDPADAPIWKRHRDMLPALSQWDSQFRLSGPFSAASEEALYTDRSILVGCGSGISSYVAHAREYLEAINPEVVSRMKPNLRGSLRSGTFSLLPPNQSKAISPQVSLTSRSHASTVATVCFDLLNQNLIYCFWCFIMILVEWATVLFHITLPINGTMDKLGHVLWPVVLGFTLFNSVNFTIHKIIHTCAFGFRSRPGRHVLYVITENSMDFFAIVMSFLCLFVNYVGRADGDGTGAWVRGWELSGGLVQLLRWEELCVITFEGGYWCHLKEWWLPGQELAAFLFVVLIFCGLFRTLRTWAMTDKCKSVGAHRLASWEKPAMATRTTQKLKSIDIIWVTRNVNWVVALDPELGELMDMSAACGRVVNVRVFVTAKFVTQTSLDEAAAGTPMEGCYFAQRPNFEELFTNILTRHQRSIVKNRESVGLFYTGPVAAHQAVKNAYHAVNNSFFLSTTKGGTFQFFAEGFDL